MRRIRWSRFGLVALAVACAWLARENARLEERVVEKERELARKDQLATSLRECMCTTRGVGDDVWLRWPRGAEERWRVVDYELSSGTPPTVMLELVQ